MIGHALELAARDLGVGLLAVTFAAVALVAVMLLTGAILRRADRHHDALVERNRADALADQLQAELRTIELRRERMRSYNARPTASERFGPVV